LAHERPQLREALVEDEELQQLLAGLVARVQVALAEPIDRDRVDLRGGRRGEARAQSREAPGEVTREPVAQRRIESALLAPEEIERLQVGDQTLDEELRRL